MADELPLARITLDDLHDHVADLDRPAVVAVENNSSDGRFITAVAHVFKASDVLDAVEKGWLVIDHGGGQSDACRRAMEEHEKFGRLKRVAALLDSDRMVPGEKTKSHSLAGKLRQAGILVHVLELREAENYIPNRALRAVKPHGEASRRLACLRRLTPAQRGHFDMKKGFGKAGGVPDSQASLFAGVPRQVIEGLTQGFGDDVIRHLQQQSQALTVADFAALGSDVSTELQGILAMLRKIV